MSARTYRITNSIQKWQFCCPRSYGTPAEHTNWFPIDSKFRCQTCRNNAVTDPEIDPESKHIIHRETGEAVGRDRIEFDTNNPFTHASG